MVHCQIGSGIIATFWHDNWTSFGPLIELVGERGPLVTGIHIDAVISEALNREGWWLDRSRSRSPTITLLRAYLPNAQEVINSEVDDTFVGFQNLEEEMGVSRPVRLGERSITTRRLSFWHKAVWFTGRIPKHAFITWIAARDRMVTRDRLRSWGLTVPANCVLCSTHQESRNHLLFECAYSAHVWSFFVSRLHLSPPQGFEAILRWLTAPSRDTNVALIVRLIFQAVLYLIWKEMNGRVHTLVEKSVRAIIAEVKQLIRLRLDPVAHRQVLEPWQLSVLAVWLLHFAE
ncbi:uncharacterized protein LOC130506959 [Raphanus sativus]|uniref:Uncharacterized protein LOC130506959 n=1 Tax=Raphanus sativus TaxID=3726 RepID=A0A9W3D1N5_RAPSA|nr:uncharacterized protein LOC130506959 [Raphanus sativus]